MKLLEENISKTFSDINHSKVSLGQSPNAKEIQQKNKTNKQTNGIYSNISFCTAKGTINKIKGKSAEWEKLLANNATDNGLISKVYKNSS